MAFQILDIAFSYGLKRIFSELSFSAKKGEIVALIGVSGSGKTTLFRLMTGLISPDCGTINAPGATYMRQEDMLLPWRTVMGNLRLFGELGKEQEKPSIKLAREMLAHVGLEDCEDLYPEELSEGMRQRVSLARALFQDRPLLLLDEPFASLDVIIREQLYQLLQQVRDQYNKTILFVTHDFRDAMALADRILVLQNGKIGAEFTPEEKHMQAIRDALAATI